MKNLDLTIRGLIWDGAATNDPNDAVKVFNNTKDSALKGDVRFDFPLADGTTDLAVQLPANPSSYLIIITDQPISMKLNGGSESIPMAPKALGTKALVQYLRGPLTGLSLSNSSGSPANVEIVIASN